MNPCVLENSIEVPAAYLTCPHKIEFSFPNGNLMAPAGNLPICWMSRQADIIHEGDFHENPHHYIGAYLFGR
jgi:hypothetical protein